MPAAEDASRAARAAAVFDRLETWVVGSATHRVGSEVMYEGSGADHAAFLYELLALSGLEAELDHIEDDEDEDDLEDDDDESDDDDE